MIPPPNGLAESFADRYTSDGELGAGGMATVYSRRASRWWRGGGIGNE
jgi:hypothetical protein